MQNNDKKMHPEDMRNLMIFAMLSIALWFLFDVFVQKPQREALQEAKKARAEIILSNPSLDMEQENVPLEQALSTSPRLTFGNDVVTGTINLQGGRIDDLRLTTYFKTIESKENVALFAPAETEKARYVDYGWVSQDSTITLPTPETQWRVKGAAHLTPSSPVTLVWNNGQGFTFERDIALDENYVFSITQRVINNAGRDVVMHPYAYVSQKGIPADYMSMWVSHEGPVGFVGGELFQKDYAAMEKNPNIRVRADKGWIGISDKYWLTALMPEQGVEATYRFKYNPNVIQKERSVYQTDYTGAAYTIAAGDVVESSYKLYAGAKKVLLLQKYEKELGIHQLDLAVDFGWFWFFTYPFFLALHFIGLLVGNMGVAIILLTIAIRMAVFPLTRISYYSFAKMKVVTPKIKELRDQHGDDKQKLQADIVELYKKEGVNPMSGCLPILVQIPIFFAFYKILLTTIEIRHAPFFGWIDNLSAMDPTSVFNLFGLLPYDVPQFLMIGAWPCMMLAVMLVQKRLNPPPQDKIQRDMMNIFPFFITFVMAKFAAGLVVYWTFSALVSVLQQMYIMRSLGVPIYIFQKDKATEAVKEQVDKGPDVHPLVELAEDEASHAIVDAPEGDKPAITPPKPKKKAKKKTTPPKKKS